MRDIRDALTNDKPRFEFFHSRSGGDEDDAKSDISTAVDLDEAVKAESNPNPEPKSVSDSIGIMDNLLYIYTSGTTGLPKAVIIKHIRY